MAATLAYHRSTDAVLSPPPSAAQGCHMASSAAGAAALAKTHQHTEEGICDKNSALTPAPTTTTASCAMTVLTAVERSVLRTLAFVFYQLEREQAKYCASSILRWYFQLQAQLPASAVASLERVATSVIALSDAKFTSFWLSLLEKEIDASDDDDEDDGGGDRGGELLESRITIQSYSEYDYEQSCKPQASREKTLIRRLYQHVYYSIQSLFSSSGKRNGSSERGHATQTPCTSPIDLSDESHYQRHHRRKHNRFGRTGYADDDEEGYSATEDADPHHHHHRDADTRYDDNDQYDASSSDDSDSDSDDLFEPGWAVEYMEQESTLVSTELSRRMRKMMHSTIPLNLFRVTVAYDSEPAEEAGEGGFLGVISPESFPPTPITRDLQTRRMHCYTVSVLDHATLALRLLEATASASQLR